MASRLETFLEDIWSSHTNKYQESDERWLVGVYWSVENYFHAEFATKSSKCTWQNPWKWMFVTCKQSSYKVTFLNLQKVPFFSFIELIWSVNIARYIPPLFTSPSGHSPFNTKSQHYGLLLLWILHSYLLVSRSSAQKELVMVNYACAFSQSCRIGEIFWMNN